MDIFEKVKRDIPEAVEVNSFEEIKKAFEKEPDVEIEAKFEYNRNPDFWGCYKKCLEHYKYKRENGL